jgi:hypothetical protein
MNVKFYELAVGAVFMVGGNVFRKTAMSMAEDDRCLSAIFRPETDVVSDGPFLPAEVAEKWKPSDVYWTEYISPAPGQRPFT